MNPSIFDVTDPVPNLYGEDIPSTAKKMEEFQRTSLHKNIWDLGDEDLFHTTWTITKSIPVECLSKLPPRIKELVMKWNAYPGKKRMVVWYNNTDDLHFYYDDRTYDTCMDSTHTISSSEKLKILEAMIPSDPFNSNGWKLDGSNEYPINSFDIEEFTLTEDFVKPKYEVPSFITKREETGGVYSGLRKALESMNPQEMNLQVFHLIRRGILQPRACL